MPNTSPKTYKKSLGFTLIELLVVITVIGALSGILLGVINSSGIRAKARDSQRKSDIKKIQTALELHFADFRAYPKSDPVAGTDPGNEAWEQIGIGRLVGELQPNYIDPVPVDPQGEVGGNNGPCEGPTFQRYNYRSNGSYYFLTAIMEVTTSKDDSPCSSMAGEAFFCAVGFGNTDVCYFAQNP